jgi:hypothetical protein
MRDVVRYFVHGVDGENVGALLDGFAERHWAYMDAHSDRLVARGPTLSADGTSHTGSVHVVEAAAMEDARRFALEEPYWLAGVYASVTVTRIHPVREGTMWDRPPADAGSGSALVLVN